MVCSICFIWFFAGRRKSIICHNPEMLIFHWFYKAFCNVSKNLGPCFVMKHGFSIGVIRFSLFGNALRKRCVGNAFLMISDPFCDFDTQKASFSIGFIRYFDMAKCYVVYSEKGNAFWRFLAPQRAPNR